MLLYRRTTTRSLSQQLEGQKLRYNNITFFSFFFKMFSYVFKKLCMCLGRTCSNIFFICQTVEAPSQLKLTENIMAFNMEENSLSLIIDDGEAYPAYRISLNKIATFLNCEENEIEEALINKLPMKASITVQHDEITQISL